MTFRRFFLFLVVALLALEASAGARADDGPAELVKKAVDAVGGRDKLLTLCRIKEKLTLNPGDSARYQERVSVVEPPKHWWVGKKDRVTAEKEPATFLVWGWTLGAVVDPESKLEALSELTDGDATLVGLRVAGTITPPMDVYFDKQTVRLTRIDWRGDIHRFSEWKELDGLKYPSRTIGYKKTGKAWYQTDIQELTRLSELPEGLSR